MRVILLILLIGGALAAPEGEKVAEGGEKVSAEKKDSGTVVTEREVAVVNDAWFSSISPSTWTLGSAVLGAVFVIAGLGVMSYYYFYFGAMDAYGGSATSTNANYVGSPHANPGYYNYQYPTGRALGGGQKWNFDWAKVLDYIDLAQKTYAGFDWQNLECQKRVLCELSQERSPVGETGRKIANSYMLTVVDVLEGIPIPQVIQAYLAEYKEAIGQGKGKKPCGDVYPKCKFSISHLLEGIKKKKE